MKRCHDIGICTGIASGMERHGMRLLKQRHLCSLRVSHSAPKAKTTAAPARHRSMHHPRLEGSAAHPAAGTTVEPGRVARSPALVALAQTDRAKAAPVATEAGAPERLVGTRGPSPANRARFVTWMTIMTITKMSLGDIGHGPSATCKTSRTRTCRRDAVIAASTPFVQGRTPTAALEWAPADLRWAILGSNQ